MDAFLAESVGSARPRGPGGLDGDCDASILVPVFNEARHIRASVAAMAAQEGAGTIEILLIDGGSSDGTQSVLAELQAEDPRVRILANPRRAIPSGLNVGLASARGRHVVRMDAHSRFPQDYIKRGVERLQRGDTRWVSGPQVPVGTNRVSRATAQAIGQPIGRGGSRRWAGGAQGEDEYQLDSGVFCGVWKRETLLEYGGWDERWGRNEDSELASRFIAQGEQLICRTDMAAQYIPRDSLLALWRQYRANGRFRVKTAVRHPSSLRVTNLLPAGVVIAAGSAVIAPRPLRISARVALALYLGALAASALKASRDTEDTSEILMVPIVLATMHGAFGAGFLVGAVQEINLAQRGGAPAVRRARGVYAPSLQ